MGKEFVVTTAEQMCQLMCDNTITKEYEFCLRCGRKLKNSDARVKGYGAVCERKLKHEAQKKLF